MGDHPSGASLQKDAAALQMIATKLLNWPDLQAWMKFQLQGFAEACVLSEQMNDYLGKGADAEARVGADQKAFLRILHGTRKLTAIKDKLDAMEVRSQAAEEQDRNKLRVLYIAIEAKVENILDHQIHSKDVAFLCGRLSSALDTHRVQLHKLCNGFHSAETSWKKDLKPDAKEEDVDKLLKKTVRTLNVDQINALHIPLDEERSVS